MATFREKRNKKEEELDREKKETGILFHLKKKPAVTRTKKKRKKVKKITPKIQMEAENGRI
jgi:hypothetical protein